MVNVPPECKQSKFMKNSKKFYKNPKANRAYFQSSDGMVSTDSHGENSSLLETSAQPAIAIVAPTARNPATHTINNSMAPCKALSGPPPMSRMMHVQHHIHHIQPVQISTTLSPPPTQSQVSAPANLSQPPPQGPWPVVEPAFHFGPGFEIHQSYCPTHSRPHADQHIVMFYLYPGVAASFQMATGDKILQGESLSTLKKTVKLVSHHAKCALNYHLLCSSRFCHLEVGLAKEKRRKNARQRSELNKWSTDNSALMTTVGGNKSEWKV